MSSSRKGLPCLATKSFKRSGKANKLSLSNDSMTFVINCSVDRHFHVPHLLKIRHNVLLFIYTLMLNVEENIYVKSNWYPS
jgi:hypothetical protein